MAIYQISPMVRIRQTRQRLRTKSKTNTHVWHVFLNLSAIFTRTQDSTLLSWESLFVLKFGYTISLVILRGIISGLGIFLETREKLCDLIVTVIVVSIICPIPIHNVL